jgi:hypothetical protein
MSSLETPLMKFCSDCYDLGLPDVKSHRIIGKRGCCEEHYRQRMGIPQRSPEALSIVERWKQLPQRVAIEIKPEAEQEPPAMPAKLKVDWDKVQADRASGTFSLDELAEKYGISRGSIFLHTRAKSNGAAPAVKEAQQHSRKHEESAPAGNKNLVEILNELKAERIEIDVAIRVIERLLSR